MQVHRTLLSTLLSSLLAMPGLAVASSAPLIVPTASTPSLGQVDWSAIRAEQDAFRAASRNRPNAKVASNEAEIRVAATGWCRVSHEDLLAAGIDFSGADASQLALSLGADRIPLIIRGGSAFGPGSAIEFYGRAVDDSLYTDTATYRLKIDRRSATRFANVGVAAALNSAYSVDVSTKVAQDREYNYSAQSEDPWASARLVRSGATSTRSTDTFEAMPAGDIGVATLTVSLTGGLDYAGNGDDHSARFLLNGVEIGRARFDGVLAQDFQTKIPTQSMTSGRNTLSVELANDTGFASDVVYVEGFRVDYQRRLTLGEEPIHFTVNTSSRAQSYVVNGANGDIVVLRDRKGVIDLVEGSADADGAYRFAFSSRAGDEVTILRRSRTSPTEIAPAAAAFDPMVGGEAQLLIVSHPSFIEDLAPLVDARRSQGISTRVVNVEDLYRFYNAGRAEPVAIQAAVAYAKKRLKTRYLLLVGGDSFDYKNHLGLGAMSFVPTHYVTTNPLVRFAPSDAMYGDVDLDGDLDIAVGRLPARNHAELNAMIAKSLDYAATPFAGKSLFVSDRADAGYSFRNASLTMQQQLGSEWAPSRLDLDDYATSNIATARTDLVTALRSGQALVSFYGHGFPTAWGSSALLSSRDVVNLTDAPPTVLVQFGCWGTYFVDPRYNALSSALLASPGGVAAMIGQSGLSFTYSDVELARRLLPKLSQMRIGDALVATSNELAAAGAGFLDVTVGTQLMGDPTLQLRAR